MAVEWIFKFKEQGTLLHAHFTMTRVYDARTEITSGLWIRIVIRAHNTRTN